MKPNKDKILQALNYLASTQKNNTISEMKAYKLLWLADRYHLRQYGRTITHDNYYALPLGVVPSNAKIMIESIPEKKEYQKFLQRSKKYYYTSIKSVNEKEFSKTDKDVLNLIIEKFGDMTPASLSKLSHQFPEWKRFEEKLEMGKRKSYKVHIDDFFENCKEKSGLFVDDDEFLSLTKELSFEMN